MLTAGFYRMCINIKNWAIETYKVKKERGNYKKANIEAILKGERKYKDIKHD